jgi:hypothetical protein
MNGYIQYGSETTVLIESSIFSKSSSKHKQKNVTQSSAVYERSNSISVHELFLPNKFTWVQ